MQVDVEKASVYVGTYRKYNEGSIFGKWLDLADYADREEFYTACAELHADEQDPEFMFQDYENIPEGLIGESWLGENIFGVLEALRNMDSKMVEPFFIFCANHHYDISKEGIDELVGAFEDGYMGQYDSEEDFARQEVEDNFDLPEFARFYFDYGAYARDLFCCDYWSEGGHVFRNA